MEDARDEIPFRVRLAAKRREHPCREAAPHTVAPEGIHADEPFRHPLEHLHDGGRQGKRADPHIYVSYGKFLAKRGRAPESLKQLQEAVRIAPRDPEAHYELANQLFRMRQFEEAAKEGQTALRVGGPEDRVHYLLARIYTALNDPQAASKQAGEAARLAEEHHRTSGTKDSVSSVPQP